MKIYNGVEEIIGKTPIMKLNRFGENNELKANLFAKLELFNPAGSVKDRVAKSMILTAEKDGLINKDTVIIEPTSGNTGIGLASLATARGYKIILTMPESMSVERRKLLKAYGAQIVLTSAELGMKGAIEKAVLLAKETKNSFVPLQFENEANPMAHYLTTGPEIWEDMGEKVDIFVGGIGTGGTVSGVGKFLKEKNSDVKIVGVEPFDSPFITKGTAGPHKIQGIGAGFIPKTYKGEFVDEVLTVTNENAISAMREFSQKEGVIVGISSGAALCAACELAMLEKNKDKNIVVLLPDTGERYLSLEHWD